MPTASLTSVGCCLAASLACLLAACTTTPPSADVAIARSAQAMGAAQLKTLRYTGAGTDYSLGQAYRPDDAWPKVS
jgi:starvation-inducible outer membrane lipoprotein